METLGFNVLNLSLYLSFCVSTLNSYFVATKLEHEVRLVLDGKVISAAKVNRIEEEAERCLGDQLAKMPTLLTESPSIGQHGKPSPIKVVR